jgi:hypothetical protein
VRHKNIIIEGSYNAKLKIAAADADNALSRALISGNGVLPYNPDR